MLTVASGAIFGWQFGSVLVVLAATLGSLGPYLLARYLFRDYLRNRYATVFKKVDQGMEQAGWTYLLSARLSAVFPFYVLNIVSGVTNITIRHYVSATFLGIIPATVVYSFAGSQIGTTTKVSELLSRGVVLSLILLALLPLVAKWVASKLKKSQQKTT